MKRLFTLALLISLGCLPAFGCNDAEPDDGDEDGDIVADGDQAGDEDLVPEQEISPDIWRPGVGTTWQWQLTGALDSSVDVAMYDIDLFTATAAEIARLHNDGRVVICYFSAGTWENWRPDKDDFPSAVIGKALPEWQDEQWFDIRAQSLRPPLLARLDMAVQKGCDGVEPDNVDGFDNDSGFDLSFDDQLAFNRWLADAAHARNLSVGLKNDLQQITQLLPWFEWALNEECSFYHECDVLRPFIDAGKAVFHTEYVDDIADGPALLTTVCADTDRSGFSTLVKLWDLTPWALTCP